MKMSSTSQRATAFERLLAGDVAMLARAISLLEAGGEQSDALSSRLRGHAGKACVIGFTGPPGAGKSTLISAYVGALRARGERVAILAVDPSSPLSGGAVLGDRIRMGRHSTDPGVFIRSVAARGHFGGLALSIPGILDAVDAAGWPTIILETVGVGQSETEIVEFVDVRVVLNAPGLGDDVQAIKAGILEIADVLVVNKCDLPLAARTVRQLQAMLELRSGDWRDVPVVTTSATKTEGLDDLEQAIAGRLDDAADIGTNARRDRRLRCLLRRRAEAAFREQLRAVATTEMDTICAQVNAGSLAIDDAASRLAAQALKAIDR